MLQRTLIGLAERLIRSPRRWGALLLLTAVPVVAAALHLRVELDSRDFAPRSRVGGLTHASVLAATGHGDPLVIVWRSDEPIGPKRAAPFLHAMAAKLRSIEGITRADAGLDPAVDRFFRETLPRHGLSMLSPEQLRLVVQRLEPKAIESRLTKPNIHPQDPLGLAALVQDAAIGFAHHPRLNLRDGLFAARGGRTYVVFAYTDPDHRSLPEAMRLMQQVDAALETTRLQVTEAGLSSVQLRAVGLLPTKVDTYATITGDAQRVGIWTTLVVFILLALTFRRLTAPVLLLIPVASGLTLAAAVTYLVLGAINVVALLFAAIVVGLGVDFGIHVVAHHRMSVAAGRSNSQAIVHALSAPGPAIIFGGLTSAGALLALGAIDFPIMTDVALLTGVGVLGASAATFLVLPLLLSATPASPSSLAGAGIGRLFAQAYGRKPRTTPFVWGLLIVAGALASTQLRFEPDPGAVLRRSLPSANAHHRFSRELGTVLTPVVVVSEGKSLDEALRRDRTAMRQLQQVAAAASVAMIDSLSRWLPDPDDQAVNLKLIAEHRRTLSAPAFDLAFRQAVARARDAAPAWLTEYLPTVRRFLSPSVDPLTLEALRRDGLGHEIDRHTMAGDTHRIVSFVYLRRSPPAGASSLRRFKDTVQQLRWSDMPYTRIVLPKGYNAVLRRGMLVATMITVASVALLLGVLLRSFIAAAIGLLPLLCGMSAVAILMAIFGVSLDLATLSIAPILVGIGVDDGMHVMSRLRAGDPPRDVLTEAGAALSITTWTTVGALLCLSQAELTAIANLGWIGAIGLLVCLGASLHLVPWVYAAAMPRTSTVEYRPSVRDREFALGGR